MDKNSLTSIQGLQAFHQLLSHGSIVEAVSCLIVFKKEGHINDLEGWSKINQFGY